MNQGVFFGQVVIGPAGSGKSTYCKVIQQMAQTLKRNIIIFNLDPAAQYNEYVCDVDIKDLITLEDVMEEMELGPNGGLLFCMQYLLQNQSWLTQKLNQVVKEDDYVIFDCPGQIELYNDQDVFRQLVKVLQNYGFSLISMYMMDINFISEQTKFLSGILQALSTQIALQLPSTTVLTKCDLVQNKQKIQKYMQYFSPDYYQSDQETQITGLDIGKYPIILNGKKKSSTAKKTEKTSNSSQNLFFQLKKVLNSNDMVSIRSLDLSDQDSIRDLLLEADYAIQYGQNIEPNQKMFDEMERNL